MTDACPPGPDGAVCLLVGPHMIHSGRHPVTRSELTWTDPPDEMGMVGRTHPGTSWEAARTVPLGKQQTLVLDALAAAGPDGLVGDAVGRSIGSPNGHRARLLELWAKNRCWVRRERGHCVCGDCHLHDPDHGVIHHPQDDCPTHGAVLTRKTATGRAAAIWSAVE